MSGTSPEKDSSPKQKPDETQAKTTRVQATHTPKSKDESPDQNQQSQCRLSRPQQSESKRKRKRTHTGQSSEEPRITSPDAVVYKPNQSDEELQEKARAKSQKYMEEMEKMGVRRSFVNCSFRPFKEKSERMEENFTSSSEDSQSPNQQNNTQTGPESDGANGPSQAGGSNQVQGNPPSWLLRRVPRVGRRRPLKKKSEWMEEKFTYPPEYSQSQNQQNPPEYSQSQNQQNNIQAGPASANGPSQPGGSNPVQGNPPSRMRSRVKKFLCLRN